MRVLLVGPYEPDNQYSISAYVETVQRGVSALGTEVDVCRPTPTRLGLRLKQVIGRRSAFFDKFVAFPRILRRKAANYDLVHIAEHGYAPYTKHLQKKPHLVTCHDLIVAKAMLGEIPDWPLSGLAKTYQKAILSGLHRAHHVVAGSQSARDDVIRLANRNDRNTSLVYLGFCREVSKIESDEAKMIVSGLTSFPENGWLLHVGGNQPNKNRIGAIKIYAELMRLPESGDIGLVMAGALPTEEMLAEVRSLARPDLVKFIIRPSDREICALYSLAAALLFPSKFEGFGLPIIEAQKCGCPVITTDAPPMNDVGGKAAIYIEPSQTSLAARKIVEALPRASELKELGFLNAERFSVDRMCAAYVGIYEELL